MKKLLSFTLVAVMLLSTLVLSSCDLLNQAKDFVHNLIGIEDGAEGRTTITKEELETSEEIQGYINELDKASIKALIADRVVASLANKTEVETSEANAETNEETINLQINLSAEKTENKKSDSYARDAMRAYLGR